MSAAIRYLLIATGSLSLGLAFLGAILPVVPTVPFLLVAAACFMRSSKRMHAWMLEHPLFGKELGDYIEGRGVLLRTKAIAMLTVWTSVPASITLLYLRFGPVTLWFIVASVMLSCALFATWYLLLHLPTRPAEPRHRPRPVEESAGG